MLLMFASPLDCELLRGGAPLSFHPSLLAQSALSKCLLNSRMGGWKDSVIQEGFWEEERLGLSLTGSTRVLIRTEEALKASASLH